MRLLTLVVALAVVSVLSLEAADDAAKIRELEVKGVKFEVPRESQAVEPVIYSSKADLAKSPVVGTAAAAIAKQVDFAKEKVAVFAWAGSGQDKVIPGEVKNWTATFTYKRGLTRDLRRHVKVFAVPKDAEVKVEMGK